MAADAVLKSRLRHLPTQPGVYLMKDGAGEIIYVGKAKSLRARVRSYFASDHPHSLKTRELVRRIADLETIVVGSETEALILENNLIKEHRPRFNVNLKDDKTYPYIKVTVQESFPRVFVTRRLQKDGARYFGPYTDVRRMRHALALVKKLYTVRSCNYNLPTDVPARPCLDYHIGRCKAPCVALQTEAEYRLMIDEILDILRGHTRRAAARLKEEMARAAADLEFERAAELRDALNQLAALESRQKVVDVQGADRDVVALARDGEEACGVILRIREGKLLGREAIFLENLDEVSNPQAIATLASRVYGLRSEGPEMDIPGEILLTDDFEDRPTLQALLRERLGRAVELRVPQRGEKVRLLELAEQNARHLLEERKLLGGTEPGGRAPAVLHELQEALELPALPRSLVCFDVSHTQGSETVAAAIGFENGKPRKAEYRRFRIKGEWGNDDFRSMQEAVGRYFRRRLEEKKPLPDLAVIDGGKGQLSAARKALEEIGLAQQRVVSLAKRDEEVFVPGKSQPIRLPRNSEALRLLQRARDEAHRFAVSYNRTLRTKRTVRSELSQIPGIGRARQQQLVERFGSVRQISRATEDQIAALPGFGPSLAREVLKHVREMVSTPAQDNAIGD